MHLFIDLLSAMFVSQRSKSGSDHQLPLTAARSFKTRRFSSSSPSPPLLLLRHPRLQGMYYRVHSGPICCKLTRAVDLMLSSGPSTYTLCVGFENGRLELWKGVVAETTVITPSSSAPVAAAASRSTAHSAVAATAHAPSVNVPSNGDSTATPAPQPSAAPAAVSDVDTNAAAERERRKADIKARMLKRKLELKAEAEAKASEQQQILAVITPVPSASAHPVPAATSPPAAATTISWTQLFVFPAK